MIDPRRKDCIKEYDENRFVQLKTEDRVELIMSSVFTLSLFLYIYNNTCSVYAPHTVCIVKYDVII